MKREYQFTLARTDRIYILAFVFILLSWELFKYFIPDTTLSEVIQSENTFIITEPVAIDENKASLQKTKKQYLANNIPLTNSNNSKSNEVIISKPLNITEAGKDELQAMGFNQRVASNITSYLAAGGKLYNKEDVMKIYGMDSIQWKQVAPNILFPIEDKEEDNSFIPNLYLPKRILDLNTVNAIDLDSLPGIGPVFADRLIAFRNSLGGFLEVEQIKSCYGIPPETIDKILPLVRIGVSVKPIDVNEVDWNTFRHPYLDKKYTAMILAYKKHHGPFNSLDEFRKVFPPDTNWCNRLLPYLAFEQEEKE